MNNNDIDVVTLAREIAEIARTTTDPEAGRRMIELVTRLLEFAGLLPDHAGTDPAGADAVDLMQ